MALRRIASLCRVCAGGRVCVGGGGVELSPSGGGGGGGGGVCRTWWWWITRCPCASTPTPRYVSVTEQSEQSEHQSRVERVYAHPSQRMCPPPTSVEAVQLVWLRASLSLVRESLLDDGRALSLGVEPPRSSGRIVPFATLGLYVGVCLLMRAATDVARLSGSCT